MISEQINNLDLYLIFHYQIMIKKINYEKSKSIKFE